MPWFRSSSATARAVVANGPTATYSTSSDRPGAASTSTTPASLDSRNIFAYITFREANGGREVTDVECLTEFLAQPRRAARQPACPHDAEQ
jgi:hypothetical protein